jgi:acyl transferase domain-containing protein/acyl-CoA synthetase (AMP-forming)/AMP-acid ligase II/NADP-dependent 3-hydroxy acid dehydrogenase YdfG/acyl carrier protein
MGDLSARFERIARRIPERCAIRVGATRLSYGELLDRVTSLASALSARGVVPGSTVALLAENVPEVAVVFLALARLGAVMLPVPTTSKEAELASMLAVAGPLILVAAEEKLATAEGALGLMREPLTCELHELGALLGASGHPSAFPVESGGEGVARGELAFLCLFSSGSTGRAKRLVRTQQACLAEVDAFAAAIALNEEDRVLCAVPLYHSYGIAVCLLPTLLVGAQLLLPPPLAGSASVHERAQQLVSIIANDRATVFPHVPYLFGALADHPPLAADALSSLRLCLSGGGLLPRQIFEKFNARFGIPIRSLYGSSETGTISINLDEGSDFQPESVGQPLAGVQVRIIDESGREQAPELVGEIAVRGPTLMTGYSDLPELNAEVFRDGFLRTGDLGRLRCDGTLTVTGRIKLLIDAGGRKVDALEVEDALRSHPEVLEAVVLGVPGLQGNQIVKAVIVARSPLTAADLKAFCRRCIADFKVPRIIEFRTEIPRTPTGKVLRSQLVSAGDAIPELRDEVLDVIRKAGAGGDAEAASASELGLDSATIVELNAVLAPHFPTLPKTFLFEQHSLAEVVRYLEQSDPESFARLRAQLGASVVAPNETELPGASAQPAAPRAVTERPVSRTSTGNTASGQVRNAERDDDIAIIGLAGRFPDADDLSEFWAQLLRGYDAIREVPAQRWAVDSYFQPERGVFGKTYSRWGGFLRDVALFDPLFFGISPHDAALIDPQERLFLETAWHALEDAAQTRVMLNGETVGTYVGVMHADYQLLSAQNLHAELQSSLFASIANRVSYFMGFRGPSLAVDTMCSSSLTALFLACENIARGHASMAIVGGVNLCLHPFKYLQTAQANFLSSDGRCRSFGADGSGYVPGEGVAALVLKPLKRALADGDPIRAVVSAVSVNHGGRTRGFTVPSPAAQADVIETALRRAQISAADIHFVEAHGTGTELGDPIELAGLSRAMQALGGRETPCAIGSVKSNIGHLEACAGLAGIAKVVLQFQHETLVASLHAERINPHLDIERTPFVVQREPSAWPRLADGRPRYACVSSFGAGGSNAHAILREAPLLVTEEVAYVPWLLLSAQTATALRALVQRWVDWLSREQVPLAAVAFTAQVGREAMQERLAVECVSQDELVAALRGWLTGEASTTLQFQAKARAATALFSGEAGKAFIELLVKNREYARLCEAWVEGANVPWERLYERHKPRRVQLPSYPFAKESYWLGPSSEPGAVAAPNLIRLFEPVWQPLLGVPGPARARAQALCLASTELADELERALGAHVSGPVVIVVPQATVPVDAWSVHGRSGTAWLADILASDLPLLVVDVCMGRRADPLAVAQRIVESQSLRSALLGAPGRVETWLSVLSSDSAEASALSGLLAAVEQDFPASRVHAASPRDLSAGATVSLALSALRAEHVGRELRVGSAGVETLSLRDLEVPTDGGLRLRRRGVHVISGGLGKLGLWVAGLLLRQPDVKVCLLGRSPLDAPRALLLASLQRLSAEVSYECVDVVDAPALALCLERVRRERGPIVGVFQCAGVPDLDVTTPLGLEECRELLAAKVEGTRALDRATREDELEAFVMFASSSAWLGDFGRGAYAVANRFQVALSSERAALVRAGQRRGRTLAIGWPLFRAGGLHLAAEAEALYLRTSGLRYLEIEEAESVLGALLEHEVPACLVLAGRSDAVTRISERVTVSRASRLGKPAAASSASEAVPLPTTGDVVARLSMWVAEVSGVPLAKVEVDANLGDYGFDSVSLAKLARKLSEGFRIEVKPTIFFAHATIAALARHFSAQPLFAPAATVTAPSAPAEPTIGDGVAIVGMSLRAPGANTLAEFWQNLTDRRVCTTEIPADRWDYRAHFGDAAPPTLRTATNRGGFIDDIAKFDAPFFRVLPSEAEQMDPQHRLFLSACWHALEDAGIDPTSLAGRHVGVFAGAQFKDYEQLLLAKGQTSAQVSTGNSHALLANRVSYFLDLHGPSEAIDTACSSSLVAFHRAVEAVKRGDAELALAGGVSLMIDPLTYIGADRLGVLSPDGRCKTFDRSANGYVRGEGLGVVVLKSLRAAVADGDPIYAVVRATSVGHGGRSTSLTAPNSASQAALLVETYERAGFEPESIGYIEAHGTGTALGDPIEVEGIQAAFDTLARRRGHPLASRHFCSVGSVKPNIGHLEPAAGILGIIKTALVLEHRVLPGNPELHEPNPLLSLADSSLRLLRETSAFEAPRAPNGNVWPRRAGVSSFGYGGTNAHAALEEWQQLGQSSEIDVSEAGAPSAGLFVLAALDDEALGRYVDAHLQWQQAQRQRLCASSVFNDYLFTCQSARSAFSHRLAVVVSSIEQLGAELLAFRRGAPCTVKCSHDSVGRRTPKGSSSASALERSAENWVAGEALVVSDLWDARLLGERRRIRTPLYPFAPKRYWVAAESPNQTRGPGPRPNGAEALPAAPGALLSAATLDQVLLELARDVSKLSLEELQRCSNLREIGFESIKIIEFCRLASSRLGVDVHPELFFELANPSVAALSDRLQERFGAALRLTQAPGSVEPAARSLAGDAERRPSGEPIAIIGMAGAMPDSPDLATFFRNLTDGRDLVSDVPSERWDYREYLGDASTQRNRTNVHVGGFLHDVALFDAKFFGISPKEATLMDPQQRLFLSAAWHAVEEAGYRASDLARFRTGLFVGVSANDYQELARDYDVEVDAYTATGIAHSVLANRVSFALNLPGPSEPVDTACSASLIAIHRAVESLQSGAADMMLAGGVNLILNARLYIAFSKAGMLSPDGHCRSFDRGANGYARAEGVGAVLLKRLSDAERDGDHIHAVIRGTATNHGGRASSLTAPNIAAQAELIETAHVRAGLDPATITYVEAHGTGTQLGDPVEISGLKRAFAALARRAGQAPTREHRCWLGSVKSNMGHAETAAGMAGLFKVVLAMQRGVIPGQLHFERLNPLIDLSDSPFAIVDENRAWDRLGDAEGRSVPRRAGISSFGFGGANAHIVVEEYRCGAAPPPKAELALVPLSARTPLALQEMAQALLEFLEASAAEPSGEAASGLEARLREAVATELGVAASDLDAQEDLRAYGFSATALKRLLNSQRRADGVALTLNDCGDRCSIARIVNVCGQLGAAGEGVADIAYTLQVGREPFAHRLAFLAATREELAQALRAYLQATPNGRTFSGRVEPSRRDREQLRELDAAAARALEARDLSRLCELWTNGAEPAWSELHLAVQRRRLSLPTYPFARDRYWLVDERPLPAGQVVASARPALEVGTSQLLLAAARWRPVATRSIDDEEALELNPGDVVLCVGVRDALGRVLAAEIARRDARLRNVSYENLAAMAGSDWAAAHAEQLANALQVEGVPTHVIHCAPPDASPEVAFRALFVLGRALLGQRLRASLRICHVFDIAALNAVASQAAVGFAQALRLENPRVVMTTLGLEGSDLDSVRAIGRALTAPVPGSMARRWAAGAEQQLVLEELARDTRSGLRAGGVYLISGGVSGIGLVFARFLAEEYRAKLVLLGRSSLSRVRADKLRELERLGAEVLYCELDIADRVAVASALAAARRRFGTINGVLHSAGVTHDGFLLRKQLTEAEQVLSPKVQGAVCLDELLADEPLDWFVMFSSIVANLGNIGQTDYAYANAFLHAYAENRETLRRAGLRQGRSLALAWQFWGDDGGMRTNAQAQRWMWEQSGIVALHAKAGVEALLGALASDEPVVATFYGDAPRIRERLRRYGEMLEGTQLPGEALAGVAETKSVELYLRGLIAEASNTDLAAVEATEPLETYGLDSVMITAVNGRLDTDLGELPKTLLFEYQTIRELAVYLVDSHPQAVSRLVAKPATDPAGRDDIPDAGSTAAQPAQRSEPALGRSEPIAIIGFAGRYPGAENVRELAENLQAGRDSIVEIPPDRWDHAGYFDTDRRAKGKTYGRWGGFIADVDKFDASYFGVPPVEAKRMDPEERLFLEVATQTFQDAGYGRAALRGQRIGVFTGVTSADYRLFGIQETERGTPTTLGFSHASIANRVSYYYDLRGPSVSIDTMCSSSLTALHYACRALRAGDCETALVGGVNLSLHPYKYVCLAEGRFLSSDGRCRAFGEGGDGYVPAEGVGALLLKPLAAALRDGDTIRALILGVAANHGGKTNGYSVPNPRAQTEVVLSAWQEAGIEPRQLDYLEAHGTGTSLGDPIEIAALAQAFERFTTDRGFCPIGSIKANVGHLEAAAGIVGITKVLLQLERDVLFPSLHAERINPNLKLEATPFFVQRSAVAWPRRERPRLAAVSSFGAGGSNAHVVLQEFTEHVPTPSAALTGPVLFVCSAQAAGQLSRYVAELEVALLASPHLPLCDVCFTLQVGRDHLPHRLAIVATDRHELLAALASFRVGESSTHTFSGVAKPKHGPSEHAIARLISPTNEDLARLARAFVAGEVLAFEHLLGARRRVALPTYPFARDRHWFSAPESARGPARTPTSRLFDPRSPVVSDHRVQGAMVVPGVALLALVLDALHCPVTCKRWAWLSPARVDATALEVRFVRSATHDGVWQVESGAPAAPIVHARCSVALASAPLPEQRLTLEALEAGLELQLQPSDLYESYARAGIEYGPSFRRITRLSSNAVSVLARIEGGPVRGARDLHAQTLDAALQGIALLAPGHTPGQTWVPFSIGSVHYLQPLRCDAWAHVRRRKDDGYDIDIYDEAGALCVLLRDLTTRPFKTSVQAALPARFFYRSTWIPTSASPSELEHENHGISA